MGDTRTPGLGRALLTHAVGLVAATAAVSLAAATVVSTRAACASGGSATATDEAATDPAMLGYVGIDLDPDETRRRFPRPAPPAGATRFLVYGVSTDLHHFWAPPSDEPPIAGAYRLPIVAWQKWHEYYERLVSPDPYERPVEAWFATGEAHERTEHDPTRKAYRWRKRVVAHRWYVDVATLDDLFALLDRSDYPWLLGWANPADPYAERAIVLKDYYID